MTGRERRGQRQRSGASGPSALHPALPAGDAVNMTTQAPAPRTIVVPVDGTDDSVRAIPFAARLADALDSELVVVSVIADFRSEAPALVERLREQLADLTPRVKRRIVQSRTVASTIAEESAGGIVCIATTAQPFDDEGFRHTITDGVVAAATSPVIVLGPECANDVTIERIVVAIDPTHDQKGLAYWSTWLGYQLEVPVEFVHVGTGEAQELGEKVGELHLEEGQTVPERLLEEAAGALLAMGSHGRTGFRRLVQGSVGARVIPHATAPVLILGPEAAREQVSR
jgi:nucleotide-binding universal stress UspA family protein